MGLSNDARGTSEAIDDRAVSKANSYDEWTTLREVIVGRGSGYLFHHIDRSFKLFFFINVGIRLDERRNEDGEYFPIPRHIVDELEEDLNGFAEILEAHGVQVHRPASLGEPEEVVTPYWKTRPTPAYNIRDQTLVLGSHIVETSTHLRSRYFENDLLKPVLYRYFRAGSSWTCMPRPSLAADSLDPAYHVHQGVDPQKLVEDEGTVSLPGLPYEIVFDGAQCIRLGRDVLVNVSNANHQLGYEWLEREFGDRFKFHRLYRMADYHIDSIIMPLRPGLMLLRSPNYLTMLPKSLAKWDVIYPPEVGEERFPDYGEFGLMLASKFIDMNVLSLSESKVVVNALNPELCDTLSARGFEVVPVRHRHRRLFGGGLHCVTLDCVRDGGYEDYFEGG